LLLFFLDFGGTGSISAGNKGAKRMNAQADELTIRRYVAQILGRLERAVGIARAADACAGAGFHDKAVEITSDLMLPLRDATTLVNATSQINRPDPD